MQAEKIEEMVVGKQDVWKWGDREVTKVQELLMEESSWGKMKNVGQEVKELTR